MPPPFRHHCWSRDHPLVAYVSYWLLLLLPPGFGFQQQFAASWIIPTSPLSSSCLTHNNNNNNNKHQAPQKKILKLWSKSSSTPAITTPDHQHQQDQQQQLNSLLTRYGFDRRMIRIQSQDLPILAEVYLNGNIELCYIRSWLLRKPSTKNKNSKKDVVQQQYHPTVQIRLLSSSSSSPGSSGSSSSDQKKEVMVVDLGQITTIWLDSDISKFDSSNSNDRNNNNLDLLLGLDEIQKEFNHLPLGSTEISLDGLYKSHVGRARSSSSSSSSTPMLTKKQIGKIISSSFSSSSSDDESYRIHADNVLRQLIKTGMGCLRLVDSQTLVDVLYHHNNHAGNNNNNNQQIPLLRRRAVAAQLLARDAKSGGRFKRMPCTFVDYQQKTFKMQPGAKDNEEEEEDDDEEIQSFTVINGGWLVVDQSVRAGSEARKFAERAVQQQQQPTNKKQESQQHHDDHQGRGGWTISDERIAQRLECLAMGEIIRKDDSTNNEEDGLEVDVREALKALGAPPSPQGARDVLVKIGRWSAPAPPPPRSQGNHNNNDGHEKQRFGGAQPWSPPVLEAARWYSLKQQQQQQQQLSSTSNKESLIIQEGYTDLTNIPFVCVDAKRTSFRDDAIGVRPRAKTGRRVKDGSKWEILVSIADVSDVYANNNNDDDDDDGNMVSSKHLAALREAALSRGVSRYDLPLGPLHLMPPMVLEALSFKTVTAISNDSKKKRQQDHIVNRCVTVWVYIDEINGKVLDAGIERSVISPPVALSYQQATDLLDGNVDTSSDPLVRRTGQVLGVVERSILSWSQQRRRNSDAAQKREERLAVKEFVASQQMQHQNHKKRQNRRDDGHDGFQRSRGHRLVDASLDLYSYCIHGLMRRSKAPIPQQAGSGQARGGRVATAPLRRYVDGMAQRQALSVLLGYGGPPLTLDECRLVSQEATDAYNNVANVRSVKNGAGATSSRATSSQKSAIRSLQMHLSGDNRKIVPAVGTGRGNEVVIVGVGALAKCKGVKGTLKPGEKLLVQVNKIDADSGNVSVSRASS